MDNTNDHGSPSLALVDMLGGSASLSDHDVDLTGQVMPDFAIEFGQQDAGFPEQSAAAMTIALIDCYRFSQECLKKAFESIHPRLSIVPFITVQECVGEARGDLDLIIYYSHASDVSEAGTVHNVSAVRQAFPSVPLIVLSDAEDAQQPKTIRSALKSGAHGFIPTRTTGIPIALAAIRFVKAGGTFAPLDLLLTNRPDRTTAMPDAARQSRLTSRQMAVLSHLQQGKANKIIAYELGMSESTVKVHVRNIMRKMGATNRTQAAYKAQKLWDSTDFGRSPEL